MLKPFTLIDPNIKADKSGWLVVPAIVKDVVTIDEILKATCTLLDIDVADMYRNAMTDGLQDAKRVYCYYSRLLTSRITRDIGALINKDHTSVCAGYKVAKDLLDSKDDQLTLKINLVGEALKKLMHEKVQN